MLLPSIVGYKCSNFPLIALIEYRICLLRLGNRSSEIYLYYWSLVMGTYRLAQGLDSGPELGSLLTTSMPLSSRADWS